MKLAKGLLCSIFVAKLIDAKRFIVKTKGEKAARFMASALDDELTLGKFNKVDTTNRCEALKYYLFFKCVKY